jgi:hypothetical protein
MYINTQKKNQETVTSINNDIKVLRFVHTEIVSHLGQCLFFSRKKLAKQKSMNHWKIKHLRNQHKDMAHKQKKF